VDLSDAGYEVEAVFFSIGGEVGLEAGFEGFGERDKTVFAAFGVVDGDGAVAEVWVRRWRRSEASASAEERAAVARRTSRSGVENNPDRE
jgi:hypothetical protein